MAERRVENRIDTPNPALPERRQHRWERWLPSQRRAASAWHDRQQIRAELFSLDRLEQHAAELALEHRAALSRGRGVSLATRIRHNRTALRRDYVQITRATSGRRSVTPAAQWFIDNYYVVEQQLRMIRDDLPAGYYHQLPKLAVGRLSGFPRITGLAWDFIAHTDSAFDAQALTRFIHAYQRVEQLTLGELWALASMLRVVLIENLRRAADRIIDDRLQRNAADRMADRLLGSPTRPAEPLDQVVPRGKRIPLPRAFAVQLARRLRDVQRSETSAVHWFEEALRAAGLDAEALVREELQTQGATNITVRNIVTSLVQLSALDWADIVESLSGVDAALREHSAYGAMDFATRNRYRTAIEELARCSHLTELEVTQRALAIGRGRDPRPEVGQVLIGTERRAFEKSLGGHLPLSIAMRRLIVRAGIGGYLTVLLGLTLLLLYAGATAVHPTSALVRALLLFTMALPASELASSLLNAAVTRLIAPQALPAMELGGVVPEAARTVVVIPILLTTVPDVLELLDQLENHFLASARGELYFALLADGGDADAAVAPNDAALIAAGLRGIERLNARYGPGRAGARFLWLYRQRRWNPAQNKWMGWERKRGKLQELNRLLRGSSETSFELSAEERAALPRAVRYVLVLDADTQLAPGAAERLIGKLEHPLNRPHFDSTKGRVTRGYGILQPRVTPAFQAGPTHTRLQDLLSGAPGLDPYAFAVSDVYQDLCGEGSFTGKGLYDIDAFERSLAGRISENAILSHDLLEGLLARAALASDVAVIESAPDRYDVAASREHRWARGDWQLLPWLLGTAPLSFLGRWKIFDNLRRTLVPPATLIALIVSWMLPTPQAWWWTFAVIGSIAVPALLPVILSTLDRPRQLRQPSGRRALRRETYLASAFSAFQLALLPDRALRMMDAIVRTLYRLLHSRRHLLDWTSAAQARRYSRLDLARYANHMSAALLVTAFVGAASLLAAPANWERIVPWLVLWLLAPWFARQLSLPLTAPEAQRLSSSQAQGLRLIGRRTWGYFERFVTADEHHLPPDNFQETPNPVVAHRTSPTNIGLYLLSTASAYRFGWLGLQEWTERLEATFATLARLERYRGHFLNWYDTRRLDPLQPTYVSTVDSGNLAGHLLTLANAIESATTQPLWHEERLAGLRDALELAAPDAAAELTAAEIDAYRAATEQAADRPAQLRLYCTRILQQSRAAAGDPADRSIDVLDGARPNWARAAAACARGHLRDLDALATETAVSASTLIDCSRASVPDSAAKQAALELLERVARIAAMARQLVQEMDFSFLLEPQRLLLSIGYRVHEACLDTSHYDLLASEARLASYIAIAKREVPTRHWFRLGRGQVPVGDSAALVSWSGSMFEYLMPSLIMSEPRGSLLERATRGAVRCQREYAAAREVPWGISESAYNQRDVEQTYQYSPFGVPALGLKRGLAANLVISPYSTALASMVEPLASSVNFQALRAMGALGRFGYFESLDFTPNRLAEGERVATIRAYMAHHQGMTIVALVNTLLDGALRREFHREPIIRAAELLLQERAPQLVDSLETGDIAEAPGAPLAIQLGSRRRRLHTWRPLTPQAQLLSNGRYVVLVNAAGSGATRWRDLAVTRWQEDRGPNEGGQAIYLRDVDSGALWSAGFHPTTAVPDAYQVTFAEDRVEIARRDGSLSTTLEMLVSAEQDAGAHRVTIVNRGSRTRTIEITSYAELVLATQAADRAHRAFSNLFIETEYLPDLEGLLAARRPRSPTDRPAWAAHMAVVEGEQVGPGEYETDRARFLGRGRSLALPRAMLERTPLSGSVGHVLDPVFSLRRRLRVARGGTVRVTFWTALAESREEALQIADKCRDPAAFSRASTLAWTRAQVHLHHLGVDAEEAGLFQRLAAHVSYFNATLRPASDALQQNQSGPSDLWALGVSGDLPIVVAQIDDTDQIDLVRQLIRAHEYWALQNLAVDLVIINETANSYAQELHASIETLAQASLAPPAKSTEPRNGRLYVLAAAQVSSPARQALFTAARAVLRGRRGGLAEQLNRLESTAAERAAPALPPRPRPFGAGVARVPTPQGAELGNGWGAFENKGREYVIRLPPGRCTPLPWINVIAQPDFGFQVSAEGAGFTWSKNSRQNPLTSWSNDAVSDPPPEVLYVRDEESGELWCPTATPIRDPDGFYVARHGQGYSVFEYHSREIDLELQQFVPRAASYKVSRLKVHNDSQSSRRLSVCAYVEWTLGPVRAANAPYVITELCAETGALLARNPWNSDFRGRVAFLDLCGAQTGRTSDRLEFLGPDRSLEAPGALRSSAPWSMRTGAGLDPCAALLTPLVLAPGETQFVTVLLGEAEGHAAAVAMIRAARARNFEQAFADIQDSWEQVLGTVQVTTPDPSFDVLMNRWLLYQTLGCRIWARAGFYQASGAYGFRDQLQDVLALAVGAPQVARAHLLTCAGRQFLEGDVQHWWMPGTGRGVRTRISDDRVWLAYGMAQYLGTTGDHALLDEPVAFLRGALLAPEAADAYFEPEISDEAGSVFEHCARALDTSLEIGAHGLPLIGTGDWNDGFNAVGAAGRGESVWLGWFLCATLEAFVPLAEARGESARALRWHTHADSLRRSLEQAGWDGDWYRRGYFDDGSPLGAAGNAECCIDSIAQSWAVLSGAANPARAAHAMAAVSERLWKPAERMALLFTPPFAHSLPDPGYIKAYPPGVRENGGQYTHAAIWSLMAHAQLGDGERAKEWFDAMSPIHHSENLDAVARYQLEPYAVAADIYAAEGHVGRGGWSWYTGSAGWLYRAGLESILGFRVVGTQLAVEPCVPKNWRRFDIAFRYRGSHYQITVTNPFGVSSGVNHAEVDHRIILRAPVRVDLLDDGAEHVIRVVMG
ncbi:MAG: glucoamylase family protein [Steroidobacteraceae bacterium]|jgi:cyclic beta-1,2-glucan synthetase